MYWFALDATRKSDSSAVRRILVFSVEMNIFSEVIVVYFAVHPRIVTAREKQTK